MKRNKLYILIFLLLIISASSGATQSLPRYSVGFMREHWLDWSDDQRVAYVLGIGAGLYSIGVEIMDKYPELNEFAGELIDRVSELPAGRIVDTVSTIYLDEAYKDVPVTVLIVNIKLFLEGAPNESSISKTDDFRGNLKVQPSL